MTETDATRWLAANGYHVQWSGYVPIVSGPFLDEPNAVGSCWQAMQTLKARNAAPTTPDDETRKGEPENARTAVQDGFNGMKGLFD